MHASRRAIEIGAAAGATTGAMIETTTARGQHGEMSIESARGAAARSGATSDDVLAAGARAGEGVGARARTIRDRVREDGIHAVEFDR